MKVLVVEDNLERIKLFKKCIALGADVAITVKQSINLIGRNNYNCIFLDYDLGIGESGGDVVNYIVDNKLQKKAQFIIHSMNGIGARSMMMKLKNYGYKAVWKPFCEILEETKNLKER